jgi:hypothetical protein
MADRPASWQAVMLAAQQAGSPADCHYGRVTGEQRCGLAVGHARSVAGWQARSLAGY